MNGTNGILSIAYERRDRIISRLKINRMLLTFILCTFVLTGCHTAPDRGSELRTMAAPTNKFVSAKSGKPYPFAIVPDTDEEHEPFSFPFLIFGAPSKDNFQGTDRKAAKTSISAAPVVDRSDVGELLAHLPDSDFNMMHHQPAISKSASSDRVIEEEQNVTVQVGYIYAFAKEKDNDYHVILGNAPGQPAQFINVEISGLPKSGPFRAQLKQARETFENFFGDNISTTGYHKFTDEPIPVRIRGSLFYDIDHPPGAVGPTGLKPTTAWEIHPVTEITFEP
jgi:hypothetical protein